jgi:hypothetical protein
MNSQGVGDWASGINDPNADEEQVASDILLKFQHSKGQVESVRDEHVKYLKAFYGIADELPAYKKGTGASNLFVPLIEPLTDTIAAKFFLTLLSHNPFIRFESDSSDKMDVLGARVLERVVKYLISDRIPGGKEQLYLWIQDACLFGHGFIHVYFDTVSHTQNGVELMPSPVNPKQPMFDATGQPVTVETVTDVIDYNGLKFEIIDINNLAIDWSTPDWRKSWVIIRERIDPEIYMERIKTSGYLPLTPEQIKEVTVGDAEYDDIQIEVDGKSGTTTGGEYNADRKKIELYHYYGKGYVPYFDKEGNVVDKIRQDCKMIVAGRKQRSGKMMTVVPPVPFGIKPIAQMKFKAKRGEALGRGVGAQIYDLQAELNATRNQRMDAINFNLNQGYIISEGSVEDETELNNRMGQIIHKSDAMSSIEPIVRQPISPDAWRHEDTIKNDAQIVTSSSDILRGEMERKETAFVGNLRNNNAGQRLEAIVFRMANEGLRELAEVMRGLLAEFTPSDNPVIVKLTQDEAEKYAAELGELYNPETKILTATPDILKRTVYAVPCISALDGDNQQKSQMLLQLMQIMQPYLQTNPQTGLPIGWQDPGQNMQLPNISFFIRQFARLNKIEGVGDAIITIPNQKVMEAQQRMAQQQMAMQQAKSGGQPEQTTSPAEIAGQSMLTNPQEAVNQQMGVEEALMS